MQNPKNDNHYLAITTQSGKENFDLSIVDEARDDVVDVDEAAKAKLGKFVTSGESS